MKAYEIGTQKGLSSLQLVDRAAPVIEPGFAILRVITASLNHRDLLVLSGAYGPKKPNDRIPLSEGIGDVIALGSDAPHIATGDRAIFAHFATWLDGEFSPSAFGYDIGITHDGWLAQLIKVPIAALIKVPDTMSDLQAAPLAAAALTAWHALVEVGKIKAGDTVLTLGTGGVSIATLQIAKAMGARVAITSSSDEKLEFVKSLGADIAINYQATPDWSAELMTATGGGGANVVVETGGQATLSQSFAAAAVNGRIVIIGALAGSANNSIPNYGAIIGKNLTLKGIAEGSRAMLARLVQTVADKGIQPVIDRTFDFEDARDAYQYLKSGVHIGKVLIRMS